MKNQTVPDVAEIEDEFAKAQSELVERFKAKLRSAADAVLSDLYTDVASHAASDAHTNYHNYLRDEFRDSLVKEVAANPGHYSWAHGVRMLLLERHPEALRTTIITDLEAKVRSLEEHIEQLRRFR